MAKILIVEDDVQLGKLTLSFLERYDHQVILADRPSTALEYFAKENFDILILDIMLPEMSGVELCAQIRKKSQVPIIMLTALDAIDDRVSGLEKGADDYIGKPFEPRELLARIHAVLRRGNVHTASETKTIQIADLTVDFKTREAFLGKDNIDLTTMEFELLSFFLEKRNAVVTRDDIMNALQGIDSNVFSRSIDILVSRLRQKLQDTTKNARFIKTVWGKGYIFLDKEQM